MYVIHFSFETNYLDHRSETILRYASHYLDHRSETILRYASHYLDHII